MEIEGKSVFLTGGARGIGRAIIEAVLDKGAKAFFVDILEEEGKTTEKELREKYGDKVTFRLCDITDGKQLTDAFEAAVSLFGSVDIFVSNAAIASEARWEEMIAINQTAAIRGCLMAYEHMRKDNGGKGGVIIIVASMSGFLYGQFHNSVYTTTKHALVAFTTCMADAPDMPARGVRWACLCPNAVETVLVQKKPGDYRDHERAKELFQKHPRIYLKTSEVAEAFLVLLQDETNNGTGLKVAKNSKAQTYHQMIVMDKSKTPIDTMIYKDRVFMATDK